MAMEELEVIDINHMWNQLQEQAQLIEHSRMNLREQYQTMEQLLLEMEIRNPLQEQMQLFEHLYIEFQEQLRVIEQLRLKTEALSPTQLKQQATQLKLMLELKLELEQLEKLASQLYRLKNRLSMPLMTLMLVQLPIHMLLSLILLPLLIRASKSIPEEATADLAAFRQRLKRPSKNPIYIQLRTAWHFLEILWAFYIQIKIDNLWLPKKSSIKQGIDILAPNNVTSLGDIKAESITVMRGGIRISGSIKLTTNNE